MQIENMRKSIEEEIANAAYERWEARGKPLSDDLADWFAAERQVCRFFYHSFPRRGTKSVDTTIDKGLKMLELMVKHGLLLTPETHELPIAGKGKSIIVQQRLSLTELSPVDLPHHAHTFGLFSLVFDISIARSELGAVPVYYFNNSGDGGSLLALHQLLYLCFVTSELLPKLHELRISTDTVAPEDSIALNSCPEIASGKIRELLKFLKLTDNFEPLKIQAALRSTSNQWSPTENLRYNKLMSYYAQREWRLNAALQDRNGYEYESLTDEMRNDLLSLDFDFFNKEVIISPSESCKRIDACLILRQVQNKHPFSFVKSIVAPNSSLGDVAKITNHVNPDIEKISLESLW